MLKTNQFILLKMIFDVSLYDAVMSKNKRGIEEILNRDYKDEMNDPTFVDPEPIDTEYLYEEHVKSDEEEVTSGSNYRWAL